MMHRRRLISVLVVGSVFLLNSAWAQMMGSEGMMQDNARQQQSAQPEQQNYPRGYGEGYGMGPGMMQGYGMGPGMMQGYGMGPGMMQGYGMGPGMMGAQGYCMGPGGKWQYRSEDCDKFMEETKETRKKLHDFRFEYGEMMRNPETTVKELREMEKQMYELREKLRQKALNQ